LVEKRGVSSAMLSRHPRHPGAADTLFVACIELGDHHVFEQVIEGFRFGCVPGRIVFMFLLIAQGLLECAERTWLVIIATHILEHREKMIETFPACLILSLACLRSCVRLHFDDATPTTGTFSSPRLTIV
jgi:hypothetical protein